MAKAKNANVKAAAGQYQVLKNLRHDGKGYRPGSKVTLDAKSAQTLLDLEVVAPLSDTPEAAK